MIGVTVDARPIRRANQDRLGVVSLVFSGLVIVVVLGLLFIEPVRQIVGLALTFREWAFLTGGVALGAGTMIVLDDRISTPVTSRNAIGAVVMLLGGWLLFGEAMAPIVLVVWNAVSGILTFWHVVAYLLGIMLLVVPAYLYYRRRYP